MGLSGNLPDTVAIDFISTFVKNVDQTQRLLLANGQHVVDFPTQGDMNFHTTNLPLHENGMVITAFAAEDKLHSNAYYSIGGGFIVDEQHFGQESRSPLKCPLSIPISS